MAGCLSDNVCVFANFVHSVLFVVFLHSVWHPLAPSKSQICKRGAVEKPHSDGWSMGQSLIFASQHGQTSLTVAPLVVNLDFFNSPTLSGFPFSSS